MTTYHYHRCLDHLDAAMGWLRLARQTDDPRHQSTAETCLAIALQHFYQLHLAELAAADRRHLAALETAAAYQDVVEHTRARIRESVNLLNRVRRPAAE